MRRQTGVMGRRMSQGGGRSGESGAEAVLAELKQGYRIHGLIAFGSKWRHTRKKAFANHR